ncbi:hypothetical protein U9M48_001366 [Paspalum notatum var. saurae]|uniref:Target of rapamycin complex subunit LST8 n=1 Tax=Paspalum notatum var. saurae TaxID=547442 RepID=A0AAQ3SIW5_PASNO
MGCRPHRRWLQRRPSLLNHFFLLSGRIRRDPRSGLPEVDCGNQGAELAVADAPAGVALAWRAWTTSGRPSPDLSPVGHDGRCRMGWQMNVDLILAFWTGTCQREYESRAAVNTVVLHQNQKELISGDQNGNIRVWDLAANTCSCDLVPDVDTAVRFLTVMWDGSIVVAANNSGTCYVWRLLKSTQTITCFEPLHKLQAHDGYILMCLLSPEFCDPNRYLATASSDQTVKIWNVDGFKLERTLVGNVLNFPFSNFPTE